MKKNLTAPQNKSAKKKLIIVIIVIASVILLLLLASIVIDLIESRKNSPTEIDYDFYPINYSEDIYEDKEYCDLIEGEFIRYCDSTTNLTVGINRENASKQGTAVAFLVEMLYDVIDGNSEEYNKNFSDEYYKTNSPKDSFTKQKIYDVTITYVSTEKSDTQTKYVYCIEYKILKNNGTFRRDIGNGSKKQYFTLVENDNGILIDSVSTARLGIK